MQIQPYLFFDGHADQAIAFYQKALGAKVDMLMRYKESPDVAHIPPGMAEKILHASLSIGKSTVLLSDGHANGKPNFDGFALSVIVPTTEESTKFFNALAEGGQVQMPLSKTFFSPSFGMLKDRFGVMWMIYVTQ